MPDARREGMTEPSCKRCGFRADQHKSASRRGAGCVSEITVLREALAASQQEVERLKDATRILEGEVLRLAETAGTLRAALAALQERHDETRREWTAACERERSTFRELVDTRHALSLAQGEVGRLTKENALLLAGVAPALPAQTTITASGNGYIAPQNTCQSASRQPEPTEEPK